MHHQLLNRISTKNLNISPLWSENYWVKAEAFCAVPGHCKGWCLSWTRYLGQRDLPIGCQDRAPWLIPLPKAKASGMDTGWESLLCLLPARAQSSPGASWGNWASPWGWRWTKHWSSIGPGLSFSALLGHGLRAPEWRKRGPGPGAGDSAGGYKVSLSLVVIKTNLHLDPTHIINPKLGNMMVYHCIRSRLVKTREPVRIRKFNIGSLAEVATPMFCTEKGVRGALEKPLVFPGAQREAHKYTIRNSYVIFKPLPISFNM